MHANCLEAASLFRHEVKIQYIADLIRRLVTFGKTALFALYGEPSADPLCPLCKEEPQTMEHWLRRCPRLDATRQNIFGSPSPPLKVLTTNPERVLALARVTLG